MVDGPPAAAPSTSPSVEASGLVETCAAPKRVTSNGPARPRRRWTDVGTREANEELRRRERVAPAPVDVSALDAWDAPEDEISSLCEPTRRRLCQADKRLCSGRLAMASE
jgi:hypothetical protein